MLKQIKKFFLIPLLFIFGYFIIHLLNPTNLPVFADESIYIRWSQLIIDDWQQYLFFPLNDGKTPIFIWALVPFQLIFKDQLLAGRFLSMLVGLSQAYTMYLLAKEFRLSKVSSWLGAFFSAVLPYWYFHHHLALMDGMLTLWISLSLLFLIRTKIVTNKKQSYSFFNVFLSGFFLGLAILTKFPGILFILPLFAIALILHSPKIKIRKIFFNFFFILMVAIMMFLLLRLHPSFSQLFARGSDFLFSWQEILFNHKWMETLPSWPTYFGYFSHYLTWPILFLSLLGIFLSKKRESLAINLGWVLYAIPIMLMGRVVFARYLISVSLFITLAAVISLDQLMKKGLVAKVFLAILIGITTFQSARFIYSIQFEPEKAEFVQSDREQYLTQWSAGYGVKETVEIITNLSNDHSVLVLSEGYFGTLPDGLLMYLHRREINNLFIEPIGQPISSFSKSTKDFANYDQVLLVANSHRISINLSKARLIKEFCRPFDAPCHQIWDVTQLVNPSP